MTILLKSFSVNLFICIIQLCDFLFKEMLQLFTTSHHVKWLLLGCIIFSIIIPTTNVSASPNHSGKITYVAIGDSLTEGLLADRTISETNGYVGYITDALHANGYRVQTYNFAKSGATSSEVLAQLKAINILRDKPNIVTVSVGVNDLTPHLKPIQKTEFKENLSQARTTVQLYNNYLSNLHDLTVYTEKSYNHLANHLTVLQAVIEQSIDETTYEKELTKYMSAISNAQEQIQATTNKLSSQEFNKQQFSTEDLEELTSIVQTATDDLTHIQDGITRTLSTLQETDFQSDFEKEATDFFDEPNLIFEETSDRIDKVEKQLQLVDEKLQDTKVIAEILPESEKIIKKSVQTIETSFENAHKEIDTIGRKIDTIMEQTKEINPDVDMYILGYYNMFPYLSDGMQQKTTPMFLALNNKIETIANKNDITFVPTYEEFEGNYQTLLPNQHDIHPSIKGYQALAKEFITAINKDYPPIDDLKYNPF